MKLQSIEILEKDNNKKGDLFGRLMGDLFHALGYDEPRLNIHKSGREIDLSANHRTENKIAIAECKAHKDKIGGDDVNKFIGAFDAEKRKKAKSKDFDLVGYFISLSGFKETAIEQEEDLDESRVILLRPEKIVEELVKGRILVPLERAAAAVDTYKGELSLAKEVDLFAYQGGWVWVVYFSTNKGQTISHYALIHAEGKPLVNELENRIIELDKTTSKKLLGLTCLSQKDEIFTERISIDETKKKYFEYLENECGEIQFEGLPTDKDSGSVKVKLESIFVPLHLNSIKQDSKEKEVETREREEIGDVLNKKNRIAILAKPGGGKSTLIKRIAVAYAFPDRRKAVNDNLPDKEWFPIFIRCRELGEKVTSSITEIINNIPNRAEINHCLRQFGLLVSNALQKGSALLLIDGLDEISEDRHRIAFVNQLRTFVATYPNINIIVTSREAGFRVVAGSLATYCSHYTLSKLNNVEIEVLCVKWHMAIIDVSDKTINDAKSLSALILSDNRLRVLAENPLLLTTLLFVKRWAGYLPTKKSVLYQEMIKLLLVTWNVEGHEQLDIDEAEPQLAYVAYWMTFHGKQTITEKDLKDCLISARKQMPEILSFTRVSPSDFIKRVESRSSLLIMSGHERLESGLVSPIYEFLHLSFQEYLTAKAVVEKYIPKNEEYKSILDIVTPHIEKENWKEVIPLVAVLSRTKAKDLVEYLTNKTHHLIANLRRKDRHDFNKFSAVLLLGNCIANEVQINLESLEPALEWFAKSPEHLKFRIEETIIKSKFGDTYKNKVTSCFFGAYEDKYVANLASAVVEVHQLQFETRNADYLNLIKERINSHEREERCIATLSLMIWAYNAAVGKPQLRTREEIEFINGSIKNLLRILNSDDLQSFYSICWYIVWLGRANLFPSKYSSEVVCVILEKWMTAKYPELTNMAAWALSVILTPNVELNICNYENLNEKILKRGIKSYSRHDKIVTILLGILTGTATNEEEIKKALQDEYSERTMIKDSDLNNNLTQFADSLNIVLKSD